MINKIMFFIIKEKPSILFNYNSHVIEIKNCLHENIGSELYNKKDELNFHRRGSKTPSVCKASFSTTLLLDLNHEIYSILDPIWNKIVTQYEMDISFIEPYELKIYSTGDSFGFHRDNYGPNSTKLDRKLNCVLQLSSNDSYTGGDLIIGDYQCSRDYGTAIFFPSNLIHCVTEVLTGERLSLIGHAWGELKN